MTETKWYEFSQNNTGGRFTGPACRVYIEAESVADACKRALSHNIYFDGVEDGTDCECCGDRWSRPWAPEKERPEPEYARRSGLYRSWAKEAGALAMWVYADGRTETEVVS